MSDKQYQTAIHPWRRTSVCRGLYATARFESDTYDAIQTTKRAHMHTCARTCPIVNCEMSLLFTAISSSPTLSLAYAASMDATSMDAISMDATSMDAISMDAISMDATSTDAICDRDTVRRVEK
ncbi:hypothetical protein SARC_02861 [Sphaeroforma arctica JP610]|uniref:Uncharacterized protein n=1 Tax=Sphaeroforma arctica JP610 TaxID=667725 RepID=A0A0L0G7P1_9EUKA|nr:hypothetical protein SARC_02861 [Sphaeroforma arctica JP610]KNC84939.1 hypothetical protein SARC_02861 [Sphaeroforma arctica JP610]|eukprot:XP_014158841.1 hypothetical protein SARC_02861 [Sphaeroforma arctica JP610]